MSDRLSVSVQPKTPGVMAGGQPFVLTVVVTNTSEIVDAYDLRVDGLPDDWWSLSEEAVSLFPNTSQVVSLTLNPPRRHDVSAGEYPLRITATSREDSREASSDDALLTVQPTGSFDVQIIPSTATGRRADYLVRLRNLSNGSNPLSLRLSDPEDALLFSPGTADAVLEPYRERDLAVRVKARRRRLVGDPERYSWSAIATPTGDQAPDAGLLPMQAISEFVYAPLWKDWPWAPLPTWTKMALLTLLPLLLMAATLLTLLAVDAGAEPPAPEPTGSGQPPATEGPDGVVALPLIRSFSFEQAPDAAGYLFRWEVDAATEVRLNDQPVEGGSVVVPEDASGQYVLLAKNDGGEVTAKIAISSSNAPIIKKFIATPSRVDPGGAAKLEWTISGASTADINGDVLAPEQVPRGVKDTPVLERDEAFLLTAENDFGYSSVALIVAVTPTVGGDGTVYTPAPPPPPPEILSFDPERQFTEGTGLDVAYATRNASRVLLLWNPTFEEMGRHEALPADSPVTIEPDTFPEDTFLIFIVASNSIGQMAADFGITTLVPVMSITNFSAPTTSGCSAALSWRVSGDSQGSVQLFRNGTQITTAPTSVGSNSYRDSFSEGSYTVTYELRASNRLGEGRDSQTRSVTVQCIA